MGIVILLVPMIGHAFVIHRIGVMSVKNYHCVLLACVVEIMSLEMKIIIYSVYVLMENMVSSVKKSLFVRIQILYVKLTWIILHVLWFTSNDVIAVMKVRTFLKEF
jgi:hypothetical protein